MATKAEIMAKYKEMHDDLTQRFYQKHELEKEEFDAQHARIWMDMEAELKLADDYVEPGPSEIDMILQQTAELEKRISRLETHFEKQ